MLGPSGPCCPLKSFKNSYRATWDPLESLFNSQMNVNFQISTLIQPRKKHVRTNRTKLTERRKLRCGLSDASCDTRATRTWLSHTELFWGSPGGGGGGCSGGVKGPVPKVVQDGSKFKITGLAQNEPEIQHGVKMDISKKAGRPKIGQNFRNYGPLLFFFSRNTVTTPSVHTKRQLPCTSCCPHALRATAWSRSTSCEGSI